MAERKKQYLYKDEVPLTTYARKKVQKDIKLNESAKDIEPLIVTDETESDRSDHMSLDINSLPEEQLLPDQDESFLQRFSVNFYDNDFFFTPDDEVLNQEDAGHNDLFSSDEEESSTLRRQIQSTHKLTDLLHEDSFFESITIHSERSPAELLLMVLKYYLANTLSAKGLANLLKLINCVCGTTVVPEKRYKIDQLCNPINNVTFYAVCPTCTNYMGIYSNVTPSKICDNCNESVDMSNPSTQCFFAIIDPSDAIREHIEANDTYYDYVLKERKHTKDVIEDIYDGHLYRKFVANLNKNEQHAYATLTFNTDGAPVFKSSKCSIWPIYVTVNEIPPNQRCKRAITTALWCGLQKPEMSIFMDVFVRTINSLSTPGIVCSIKGEERRIKVYALLACMDSQARAPMNGSSQYNANYGCDWCLHEGQYFAGSMRYPFQFPLPRPRDHTSTIEHAREAVNSGRRIFGIITASPLLNLRKFDIIEGFAPDYLHFLLSGVIQQVTTYILRHLRKSDIDYINNVLENIKVPRQIGRLTRSLEHRGFWKAKEFENWALYYSIPVISSCYQNNAILKHWSLLVDSLHTCLGQTITFAQLNQVQEMLHKFVSEMEYLYSLASLTYNVHQLLHTCTSIYNWGPLWTHSTFPYESANHRLLTAIQGSKGVILQIARYESIQRCTQILEDKIYRDCPNSVIEYCENVQTPLTKKTFKLSDITYIGKEKIVQRDIAEKFNISKKANAYYKIIYEGCIFTNTRKINARSCDHFAQLIDGRFVKLIDFIVDNNKEITICQVIKTKANFYSTVIRDVSEFTDSICIETHEICKICVYIEVENKAFIIPVPHKLQY